MLRIATPPPPTPEPSVAAPRQDWRAIDVPATWEPVASQTESGPLETAASPSETVAIAPRTPDADVSQRSASALVPRLTIPAPLIEEPKPTQRRTGREPPPAAAPFIARSAPAAEPRPPVREFEDWAKSQAELRAALSEWLILSGRRDAAAAASEAVVILGADGRTAKSHVPMRTAGGIIVHEQRWKREANGWSLVDDRELWRASRSSYARCARQNHSPIRRRRGVSCGISHPSWCRIVLTAYGSPPCGRHRVAASA